jgi:hypothetical protein
VYHVFDLNLASVYQLPATQFPSGVTLRLFRGEGTSRTSRQCWRAQG